MFPVPFQLVLAWHPTNTAMGDLVEEIRARFQGDDSDTSDPNHGVNTGTIRLDADVRWYRLRQHQWQWQGRSVRGPRPLELLPQAHTLVVALVDRNFATDPGYVAWLEDAREKASGHSCVIFPVVVAEGDDQTYGESGGRVFTTLQGLRYFRQPDAPLRPAHLMLRITYEASRLLGGKGVRVFLSHAKVDGLPLVQSLRSLITDLAWLPYFYDVKDLAPGQDFGHELRKGVRESALIIVRTGAYDGREWCRAEVDEALQHRVAVLVVEASDRVQRDQNPTYMNNLPVVRVTDGDLFRPLDALLREQLRCLIVRRLVERLGEERRLNPARTLLLVRPPELADLFRFEKELKKNRVDTIVYPGPSLPHWEGSMLAAVARKMFGCQLKSTDDFYGQE